LISFIALQFDNDNSFNGWWLTIFSFMVFSFISPIVYFSYSKPTVQKAGLLILTWVTLYFAFTLTRPCTRGCEGISRLFYGAVLGWCPGSLFVSVLILMSRVGVHQARLRESGVGQFQENVQPRPSGVKQRLLYYSTVVGAMSFVAGSLLLLMWLFSERWVMDYDFLVWPVVFIGVGMGLIAYRVMARQKP
jgi:hypothetical protein